MRVADILGLAVSSLWQQKVRTLLTVLGVVFGSFVLAASLSIGQGIQDTIERESRRHDFLRRIQVFPKERDAGSELPAEEVKGEMSDAKRRRIRQALVEYKLQFRPNNPRPALTRENLQALAALDHVEAVVPIVWQHGFAVLDNQAQGAGVGTARPSDASGRARLVEGRFFDTATERTALVSEFLLYRYGLINDKDMDSVLGKKLRLELRPQRRDAGFGLGLLKPDGGEVTRAERAALDKIGNQLPAALDRLDLTAQEKEILRKAIGGAGAPQPKGAEMITEEYTIVGVVRLPTTEEQQEAWDPLRANGDVILPVQTAADLYFRLPGQREEGVYHAVVIVDREENVKEVALRITESGLTSFAANEHIQRERMLYLMIFGAMTCVSGVALLVAALGIANTMLMSVIERTREIGIMKAVGASNGHLQLIFLVEGALIGLCGGGMGLLLAWAASIPADAWVRSMVSRELKIVLKEEIFVFPVWLVVASLTFAVVVTTLAAVYPARRAAKVDPVAALRHE